MRTKGFLKIDYNLLMSGTWVLEKKGKMKLYKFEKPVGGGKVVIENGIQVPTTFDSKVLDFLMMKAQNADWEREIVIPSVNTIISELGLSRRKQSVDRIKMALRVLKHTVLEFHNCFIDNGVLKHFKKGNFELISIGIIDSYSFDRVRGRGNPLQLKVVFNEDFLSLCKHSLGYKLVPYAPISSLSDTTYALYKWAWRWFNSRQGMGERVIGNGKALIEWYKNELNSVAKYKTPAEVARRIKSATRQLNQNPKIPFKIELMKEDGIFKLQIKEKNVPKFFDYMPKILRKAVIADLERQDNIKDPYAVARAMTEFQLRHYVRRFGIIKLQDEDVFLVIYANLHSSGLVVGTSEGDSYIIAVNMLECKHPSDCYKVLANELGSRWRDMTVSGEILLEGVKMPEVKEVKEEEQAVATN